MRTAEPRDFPARGRERAGAEFGPHGSRLAALAPHHEGVGNAATRTNLTSGGYTHQDLTLSPSKGEVRDLMPEGSPLFTSPLWGEVGLRSNPVEGAVGTSSADRALFGPDYERGTPRLPRKGEGEGRR